MRLDEQKVFLFTFHTDQGDVQFPMRAETREEAADKMQKTLQRMQAEVSIDFPRVARVQPAQEDEKTDTSSLVVPPEVLVMRIETLLSDLGANELTEKAKAETIKNWTGFPFERTNYTQIINELQLILTGQKEIPSKKK